MTLDAVQTHEDLVVEAGVDLEVFVALYLRTRFPLPPNDYHREVFARIKRHYSDRENESLVDEAPRGAAKSTLVSWAGLLHDVMFGYEAFIAVFSTGERLSEGLVKDLHQVLTSPESYADLHRDLGPIEVIGTRTDFVAKCPYGEPRGTRIAAFAIGSMVRGEKHDGVRITKAVLDDVDHPKRVLNPTLRDEAWTYLEADIGKAGVPRGYLRHVVGTRHHADGIVGRAASSPAWTAKRWQSIVRWPTRTDLWEECRRLWADLSDPHRLRTAAAYYRAHQVEMDQSAEVLWPESEPIYELMTQWWANRATFLREKQNSPIDPELSVFSKDSIRQCRVEEQHIHTSTGRRVALADCRVAVWLDPRASDQVRRGDYAALATVARDAHGYRYVLSVDMQRDSAASARARVWRAFERFPKATFGYENNGFAALNDEGFRRERSDRQANRMPWNLQVTGYVSSEDKMSRIMRLAPDIENGWIEFASTVPDAVLEQLCAVPTGHHDDGPDALERAVWLVDTGATQVVEFGGRIHTR